MPWSLLLLALLGACATRSADVMPLASDPGRYAAWSCDALYDEADRVRQRAAQVAYAVDERSGNNIVALSLGVTVFWPALLAMRPNGVDAQTLAELRGQDEALRVAQARQACPPVPEATVAGARGGVADRAWRAPGLRRTRRRGRAGA